MKRAKLTNTAVEKFKCSAGKKHEVLWCGSTGGFGVRVSASGDVRSYILQYRVKGSGKERTITIGRHNDPWRVDDARAEADELKVQMRKGLDPVVETEKKKVADQRQETLDKVQAVSLREILEDYLLNHRTKHGPLRPATQADYRRHVTTNLADWIDKPVATITRDKCLARFNELSARAPSQANQCLVYLRALLNHAREKYATDDEYPLLPVNPVTRAFKLQKPNPERARETRIPLERVGAVWSMLQARRAEARTIDERTSADWICFVMLTGARRKESGCLRWQQVNFDEGHFHLLGNVVKNHNGITLPMSSALRVLLKDRQALPSVADKVERRRRRPIRKGSDYVFPSWGKAGYITAAQATMEAVSEVAGMHIVMHDFRRTLDDIAMECKVDSDQRRQLINHGSSGDVHARHYANNRGNLSAAVEAIANWIIGQAAIAEAGPNVVPLRG